MKLSSSKHQPLQLVSPSFPEPGKNFWSVSDCFSAPGRPVTCFVHAHYQMALHAHEFMEINVVISGKGKHCFEQDSFPTSAGDVFVILPHVQHGYVQEKPMDVYHMLLQPAFINQHKIEIQTLPGYLLLFTVEPYFRTETGFRNHLRLDHDRHQRVVDILDMIQREVVETGAGSFQSVESLTLGFIAVLCRYYMEQHAECESDETNQHAPSRAIRLAIEFVTSHYADKISLDSLAQAAHMQRNYLCRVFHKVTGLSPMDYVNQYRLNMAWRLLQGTDLNVTEIAHETGFYDSAHFTHLFSRAFGRPPSHFRSTSHHAPLS